MALISRHIASLAESQSLAMAQRVAQMRQQGIDVISMTLGEPDFDTPEHIKQAAQQAIADNYSHYGPVKGLLSLREAISVQTRSSYSPDEIIESHKRYTQYSRFCCHRLTITYVQRRVCHHIMHVYRVYLDPIRLQFGF